MTEHERLIRQGYDAWNRGDWESMEAVLAPDFEVDATNRVLNPDRYEGIDGFRRLAGEMAEVWDTWEIEPLELVERGNLMFVAHRVRARGKGSGVEVVQTYWSVWAVRDNKGVKLSLFVDRDRALAAAGLTDADVT
jgi:ketosteroid isomerase-like protein